MRVGLLLEAHAVDLAIENAVFDADFVAFSTMSGDNFSIELLDLMEDDFVGIFAKFCEMFGVETPDSLLVGIFDAAIASAAIASTKQELGVTHLEHLKASEAVDEVFTGAWFVHESGGGVSLHLLSEGDSSHGALMLIVVFFSSVAFNELMFTNIISANSLNKNEIVSAFVEFGDGSA